MTTAGGDQTASGNAALSNILNADDSTLKTSIQTFLGPLANDIDLTNDLPVLDAIGAQLASSSSSSSSSSSAAVPAPTAAVPAVPAKAPPKPKTLEEDLEAQILGRAESLVNLLPDGDKLDAKLKALGNAHPVAVYAALIAAAVAQHKLGLKTSLSHKFALLKDVSVTPTVGIGGAGQPMISSVGASATYDFNANTSMTAGASHSFASTSTTAGKTTAVPANTTETLEVDGKELHGLLQSWTLKGTHESFDAPKPNTDAMMAAVSVAISQVPGLTFKLQDTETWAAAPAVKGVPETTSSPRNATNALQGTLTDKVNFLGMEGVQLTATGTFNSGEGHKQSTLGAGVTFPAYRGVTVSIGDTTAIGPGTAGSTQAINFTLKSGLSFMISHSDSTTPANTPGMDPADYSRPMGGGGHTFIGIGFKKSF